MRARRFRVGRRLGLSVVLALAALGIAASLWRGDDPSRPPAPPQGVALRPAAGLVVTEPAPDVLPPLPASLRDSEVDGALVVDASGRFVPHASALALFDYYLSASGEEPLPVIRARILAHARESLPAAAAAEAEALLDTYLRYRDEMRVLTSEGRAPVDLERRLQWIREERRRNFGASLAETLFGEEERVVAVDLERRRVLQDAALSPEEKTRRIAGLEAELPQGVRESRARVAALARSNSEVAALRESGAGEAAVFAAREREFGTEAAERLAALDRENAAWEARLAAWRQERADLLADASLAATERAARVEALLAERFDAQERLRVRALDEAAAQSVANGAARQ